MEKSDENGQRETAVARNVEDEQHEHKDQGCLANEDGKLIDQMGQHDFRHLNTCRKKVTIKIACRLKSREREIGCVFRTGHDATVEETRLSLVDEDGSCQCDGNKVDNPVGRERERETAIISLEIPQKKML